MKSPLVSVIVPLYRSQETLGRCLASLRQQTFQDFELILVDSSPGDACDGIVRERLPEARYERVAERLLPQAARNHGAALARGELLVFTDPDIYPQTDWLACLVAARRAGHPVVFGAIACHGSRWLDRGVHLCKFNICLPGGAARSVPLGWSGNVLIDRDVFGAMGGWDEAPFQGDSVFSARLRCAGYDLWFEPAAVVDHDHEGVSLRGFVAERFRRGREYGALRLGGGIGVRDESSGSALGAMATAPARVSHRLRYIRRAAHEAALGADFWIALPVVVCGVTAWYAGLVAAAWRRGR